MIGQTISHYRILEKLGGGDMGAAPQLVAYDLRAQTPTIGTKLTTELDAATSA